MRQEVKYFISKYKQLCLEITTADNRLVNIIKKYSTPIG